MVKIIRSVLSLYLKIRFVWEKKKNTIIREMLFIKQAQTFVQLIVFRAPFVHFRFVIFIKEELARMLIHCYKIFNFKMSFKCRCQCASYMLIKNFEHSWYQVTFLIALSKNFVLIQVFFLPWVLNKKNNIENKKYHVTFIPFKS